MTILLATGCTDQSANVAEHDEPEEDTSPAQIVVLRVKAPMPPPSGQCCYPIGEPRTPEFHYCAGSVAHPGAVYCLEHKRLPDYALPSVTKHLIADQEFCVVP